MSHHLTKANPISHEQLNRVLESHRLFIQTKGADGQWADLSYLIIEGYDFSGEDLNDVAAVGSRIINCGFKGVQWVGANLESTEVINCNFSRANLMRLECYQCHFIDCNFSEANLTKAEFDECELRTVIFSAASVSGMLLQDCTIQETTIPTV